MASLDKTELEELRAIARSAAWGAAEILRSMQSGDLNTQDAGDGPVTAADLAANRHILDAIQSACGHAQFAYLSEETYKKEKPGLIAQPYIWVIDPLDGTKDFINGTDEFAVHIALVHEERPILGVVARPAAQVLYSAVKGRGTLAELPDGTQRPIQVSSQHQLPELRVVASRSHRNERFDQLMQQLPCQNQRSVGSIGGKVAEIVEQRAEVYISLSGSSAPKDWDLAAPEIILTEAGGQFTRFDEAPLLYGQPDIHHWGGLLATNGPCHHQLCGVIQSLMAAIEDD